MTMIWTPDYEDAVWPSVSIVNIKALVGIPINAGIPLRGRFPKGLTISQEDSITPPDFFYAGSMPVVSQSLAETLQRLNCRFESFELETSKLVGEGTYFFFNLLESVDRLDWQHSEFAERGGFATSISKLCLLDVDSESPVYRIAKTVPSLIAVSEDACRILLRKEFTGFRLMAAESWENPAVIA